MFSSSKPVAVRAHVLLVLLLALANFRSVDSATCERCRSSSDSSGGADTITQGSGSRASCTLAADVAHTAQRMCGTTPIKQALRSVHVRSETTEEVAQILVGLGFDATLDLQLLGQGGGPEGEELMAELKANRVSIGDRGKIRLLLSSSTTSALGT